MHPVYIFLIRHYSENKFPFQLYMKATLVSFDFIKDLAYDFILNFIKLDLREQLYFIEM